MIKSILLSSAAAIALSACAMNEQQAAGGDLQAQLNAANSENTSLRTEVASLKSSGNGSVGTDSLVPSNAKPGECYARVTQPAQFKTVKEQVLATEASEKVRVIPATYKSVQEKILAEEAYTKLEVIPATYKTVEERILVKPAGKRVSTVPATYKTVTERIKVRDAYTAWKPGGKVIAVGQNALGGTILQNRTSTTGEVMCLVEVPAEYRTVSKRVQASAAQTRETEVPAVYKTVKKRVVATPASTREVTVPAHYHNITKTVEATPASVQRTPVPETFKTITKTIEAAAARTVWTSVLCDVNTTPDVVSRMQRALKSAGHYRGPIDGVVGSMTTRAISSYQSAQGVKSDILTIDSAKKLGIL